MSGNRISQGDLLFLTLILSVAGIVISGYLTWQWFEAASASWCDVSTYFSCSRVRDSPYSAVGGVPTAVVGVAGFAVLLALAVLLLRGRTSLGPLPVLPALLVFAVIGASVGLGLTVVEVFIIGAVCILCAAGFAIDLAIFALAFTLWRGSSRFDGLHGDEEVLRP